MKTLKQTKFSNDDAMAIGAIVFGLFCLFAMVLGIIYIMAINSNESAITDTFGNTVSPVTNTSQSVITTAETVGSNMMIPLVLIGGVIAICAVVFMIWAASKSGGWR